MAFLPRIPADLSDDARWGALFDRLAVAEASHILILERLAHMSTIATDTQAAVGALNAKVDQFIAAVAPAIAALTTSLAAAQAQLAAEQSDNVADAATLSATITVAQDEASKVQAALDALGTPTTP